MAWAVAGESSDGLTITQFPAAMAPNYNKILVNIKVIAINKENK